MAEEATAAVSPQASETFTQTMARLGGVDGPPEDTTAAPETEATEEPEAEAAPAEPKTEEKPKPAGNEKLSQLKALAEELGLEVDSGKVAHAERVEFRKYKEKQLKRIAAEEADLVSRIKEVKNSFEGDLTKAQSILEKYEAGDYEGLAQALGAKDWNALQEDIIAKNSDPNFKKLRELEQWKAEQETQSKRQQEERAQHEESQRAQAAQARYVEDLGKRMRSSKDPIVAAMCDDPMFVDTIFQIQKENYDGTGTVSPEQALRMSVRGGRSAVVEHLRELHGRLSKAFGMPAAPEPAPSTDKPGSKPRPKSSVVSPVEKEAASPPGKWKDKKSWDDYERRRLAEAIEADRVAEVKERGGR
jgi:hypothetical protein